MTQKEVATIRELFLGGMAVLSIAKKYPDYTPRTIRMVCNNQLHCDYAYSKLITPKPSIKDYMGVTIACVSAGLTDKQTGNVINNLAEFCFNEKTIKAQINKITNKKKDNS